MKITWHVPKAEERNVKALSEQHVRRKKSSLSSFVTFMWRVYLNEYNDTSGSFNPWHRHENKHDRLAFQELIRDYLARHESDIANSINDFGDLKKAFKIVIGYEPEP